MHARKLLLCLLIATGTLSMAVGSQAAVDVSVGVTIGPPAPIVEVAPAPRPGYIWAPGYYGWNGYQYIWVRGHSMMERPGHYWVAERWVQRGPRWHFEEGRWERHQHWNKGKKRGHRDDRD